MTVALPTVIVEAKSGEPQAPAVTKGLELDAGERNFLTFRKYYLEDSVPPGQQSQVVQSPEDRPAKDVPAKVGAPIRIDEAGTLDTSISQKPEREFRMAGRAQDEHSSRHIGYPPPVVDRVPEQRKRSPNRKQESPGDKSIQEKYRS